MSTVTPIEDRLAAVEVALANLQHQILKDSRNENWLEQFTGSFKDEPAFSEVVEYGRQFRTLGQSQENDQP